MLIATRMMPCRCSLVGAGLRVQETRNEGDGGDPAAGCVTYRCEWTNLATTAPAVVLDTTA